MDIWRHHIHHHKSFREIFYWSLVLAALGEVPHSAVAMGISRKEEVPPFEEEVEELPAEKTEGEESSKIDTDAYVEEEFEPDSDHK